MDRSANIARPVPIPAARDVLELLKPVTWFPPMWAFFCGVMSSGAPLNDRWLFLLGGVLLAGPMVCGTSQAVNDWYDRHVDAINQPERPIPSGRIAGRWGLYVALIGSALSLVLGAVLGFWVFIATIVGLLCAWGYSAPPFRFKMSGWVGPGVVALSYEGLSWFTGASVMSGGLPDSRVLLVILLYSIGAHGIMTLNDFKAVEGDTAMGVRSLPVTLGIANAARLACAVMALPQVVVIALLLNWGLAISAIAVTLLLAMQLVFMRRLLTDPNKYAPWYNATGVSSYVFGMLAAALGLGGWI
ncbi:MAG: chlorophyll synthase ChlG [Blastomonas sp.]|uniref:chlorophyll synthase ChlG n=1 Tax=Blastomonas sp. TaxID=1909299 RepID=UPI00259084D2|nr:chlorophyll synthase ChlG [Blastomonas sp.]MCO5791717.1 chlorophyll synthase ChlG [Blastomonas sp.]